MHSDKSTRVYFFLLLGAVAATAALGVAYFFLSFGAGLVLAAPAAITAGSLTIPVDLKKKELCEAREKLSKEALDNAMNQLWAACMSFKELKEALE